MAYENHYQQTEEPKVDCLLFDVDETLYPLSSGLSPVCTKNIIEYMINKLGIEEDKAPVMCVQLYREYGTTMAGLKAIGYEFDNDDYHSYVHGRLPYEFLKLDPVLRSLLQSLPIRKVIFSNANEEHVARVLSRLGLEDCFDDVICFETLNPVSENSKCQDNGEFEPSKKLPTTPIVCKPVAFSFEQAFKIAGVNPQKTIFFDDSIRNIQTGKRMGLHTVWVGAAHRVEGVDYALESIHNIREALPELWDAEDDKKEKVYCSGEVAIETIVRA